MKVESPEFLVPSNEWNSLGICIRYRKCWIIDGRLTHGTDCRCSPRDNLLFSLNMQGAE